jgi:hypothetical protein
MEETEKSLPYFIKGIEKSLPVNLETMLHSLLGQEMESA